MTSIDKEMHERPRMTVRMAGLFILAVIAGLPSLRGGFLSGDDYHLVRNHVLVNHPSLAHAVKLFTIVHRDLYQPIPLVSFSIDFAIMNALGLQPVVDGPHAGAWVFHLTNVFLHAVNTVLVFAALRRLSGPNAVAGVAAIIFAVHPLAAEPVAWINGRMMMLSTSFTLATLITLDAWNNRPTGLRVAGVILFALLAHMSKVSIAIPVLALIFPLLRGRRPTRAWWGMWLAVSIITAAFTVFAVESSGEMFDRAEEEMSGPPMLYVLLALGQYFRQYFIPLGLSPWYPPPPEIHWTTPIVLISAATVTLVILLALLAVRRTRVGVLGLLWFLAAVAPTLPIVPARRAVAADRYVYLPNVGVHWIVATAVVALFVYFGRKTVLHRRITVSQWGLGAVFVAFAGGLLFVTWHVQSFYRDNITLAHRIIQCAPRFPGVYESGAWAYYREGRYEEAIRIALQDLEYHPVEMACEVYQVVGMSQFRLGRHQEALASLHKAIEANPDYGKCYTRLATIQSEMGRYDGAIKNYERGVEIMPYYNPGLLNLADAYRAVGRMDDAMKTYEKVLASNLYDVTAQLALAEIQIGRGSYESARARLEKLVSWMPENAVAWTNLGLCYELVNRFGDAREAYATAIARERSNIVAIGNLVSLYLHQDDYKAAGGLLEALRPTNSTNLRFLIIYHDFAVRTDNVGTSAESLVRAARQKPEDGELGAWAAYTLVQTGRIEEAADMLARRGAEAVTALGLITEALAALHRGDVDLAIERVRALLAMDSPQPEDAVARLIGDLRSFSLTHPADPWPFYLSTMVLLAQGQGELAHVTIGQFTALCGTDDCRARAEALMK